MARVRALLASFMLTTCTCAFALNPSLDISQYGHTKWSIEDGTLKSRIQAIAQTPDGYLWLGTEEGLVRFDGSRFVSWEPPKGDRLPGHYIYSLLVSRDGRLWIAADKGLASWDGIRLFQYSELAGERVVSLAEDHEGTLWAGSFKPTGQLCAIRGAKPQCFGGTDRFGLGVDSLYDDKDDNLWVSSQAGLWRWKPGPAKLYQAPAAEGLGQDEAGRLVLATPHGLFRLEGRKAVPYPSPVDGRPVGAMRLLQDREGDLWIGRTDQGLLRLHGARAEGFARSDGLSGEAVMSLFEDREGDMWVATLDGLDRFRELPVAKLSVKEGLPIDALFVLAAKDGEVWLGTHNDFYSWNGGRLTVRWEGNGLPAATINGVFQDRTGRIWVSTYKTLGRFENGRLAPAAGASGGLVYGMADDNAGSLWISTNLNLSHVFGDGAVEQIPWPRLGHEDWAMAMLRDRFRGGIWLGFWNGGIVYLRDGHVRKSYGEADGLGRGLVSGLELDDDGALWAATEGGLSRIKDGRVTTLTSKSGLPCDAVHWTIEDDNHFNWLYTTCGLVRVARRELNAWIADPTHVVQNTVFDGSDGVRLHSQRRSGNAPQVTKAADGRLWFVSGAGISIIDPRHIPVNELPPPVHVEQIVSDDKVRWPDSSGAAANLRLPPLSRDVRIDYTALSLVAPEKIRFKYKLEGYDRDWQDAGNRRQAFYTILPPRKYRFRVIASNNTGVWNRTGDALEFSIDPAYYQTSWFQAGCGVLVVTILWGIYRYRVHQIAQNFTVRLEERVAERTRIARELHDTLLQSFQGLMFRFQAVDDLLPEGKAKDQLERALERADRAIAEGRTAVYDLRSSASTTNDLAQVVKSLGEELASADSAAFRLVVEGVPRELHPIIRDEIYRIAREALRNAFGHAEAQHIETEITYAERALRLRIRDDGKGIPPEFLEEGRRGHYGLCGMRERARQIGGKLNIWSRPGTGAEIEFSVAGAIAYRALVGRAFFGIFRKKRDAV